MRSSYVKLSSTYEMHSSSPSSMSRLAMTNATLLPLAYSTRTLGTHEWFMQHTNEYNAVPLKG